MRAAKGLHQNDGYFSQRSNLLHSKVSLKPNSHKLAADSSVTTTARHGKKKSQGGQTALLLKAPASSEADSDQELEGLGRQDADTQGSAQA